MLRQIPHPAHRAPHQARQAHRPAHRPAHLLVSHQVILKAYLLAKICQFMMISTPCRKIFNR